MRRDHLPVALAALLFAAAACAPSGSDASPRPDTADAAGAPQPAATGRVDIPAAVRANLGITFAEVELRSVADTLRVPGAFELQPRARSEYRMSLPGTVELLVDELEPVAPDQPLFRYRSPAWPELMHEIVASEQELRTAEAEIAVARAKLAEAECNAAVARERIDALAQAEVRRADLEAEVAGLEASLPRLRAELELGEVGLENARSSHEHALHRAAIATGISEGELVSDAEHDGRTVPRFRVVEWIEVRARGAGVVERLAVTDGEFVEAPGLVLATVRPDLLRFRAVALQGDVPRIAAAVRGRIVPPQGGGVPIGTGVDAMLELGLDADPVDRTTHVLARPEELAAWMRPGGSAFLEVVLDETSSPALAIPRSAVVQDGLRHVFFRRDPANPNQAIRVEADLGVGDGRWVVVNSGVMRGDEVVLDGAFELRLATAQGAGASQGGHFHADGSFHDEH